MREHFVCLFSCNFVERENTMNVYFPVILWRENTMNVYFPVILWRENTMNVYVLVILSESVLPGSIHWAGK